MWCEISWNAARSARSRSAARLRVYLSRSMGHDSELGPCFRPGFPASSGWSQGLPELLGNGVRPPWTARRGRLALQAWLRRQLYVYMRPVHDAIPPIAAPATRHRIVILERPKTMLCPPSKLGALSSSWAGLLPARSTVKYEIPFLPISPIRPGCSLVAEALLPPAIVLHHHHHQHCRVLFSLFRLSSTRRSRTRGLRPRWLLNDMTRDEERVTVPGVPTIPVCPG